MIENVSRRGFLKGALAVSGAGLTLAVVGPRSKAWAPPFAETGTSFQPNAFVAIEPSGQVSIVTARSEMGQGVRTSMPMLVAEELDVDWDSIKIVQGDGDPKYGNQNTDGSTSVRTQWNPLRQAGATARSMLVAAAAAKWGVDAAACVTEKGAVYHKGSNRKASYGELAAKAAELPVPEKVTLKNPKDFKIIGTSKTFLDLPEIVRGEARYGIDVQFDGLKIGSVERCPVRGGTIKSFNADKALAIKGVRKVTPMETAGPPANTYNGLLVVADNTWAAIKGRRALEIEWDYGQHAAETTAALDKQLAEATAKPGKAFRNEGDAMAALAKSENVVEAVYESPFLAHSPMEPPNCTVIYKGDSAEIWAPTQAPQWARAQVAKALGFEADKVTVHVTLLGGGFGRKSKPDFVVEAALAGKAAGSPLKVVWTREDEIRFGYYRSQNRQLLRAALDSRGMPEAWLHRSAFPSIQTTFNPENKTPASWEMGQSAQNVPFRIPNLLVEAGTVDTSLRIGWLRSVHHTFHSWAVNCFADELAAKAGKDPLEYHLALLGEPRVIELSEQDKKNPYKFDTGRLIKVINLVKAKSGWGKKLPKGRALGFAAQYSFFSYVAMVADVTVDDAGALKINRYVTAVDCGAVVNPDTVKAQMEGGVIFALSAALYGKLTVDQGRVVEGNFDAYRMVRIGDAPPVETHIVDSDAAPTGIGEPPVPPTAPALCNAIYAATGKRWRTLPLPEKLA